MPVYITSAQFPTVDSLRKPSTERLSGVSASHDVVQESNTADVTKRKVRKRRRSTTKDMTAGKVKVQMAPGAFLRSCRNKTRTERTTVAKTTGKSKIRIVGKQSFKAPPVFIGIRRVLFVFLNVSFDLLFSFCPCVLSLYVLHSILPSIHIMVFAVPHFLLAYRSHARPKESLATLRLLLQFGGQMKVFVSRQEMPVYEAPYKKEGPSNPNNKEVYMTPCMKTIQNNTTQQSNQSAIG